MGEIEALYSRRWSIQFQVNSAIFQNVYVIIIMMIVIKYQYNIERYW